MKRRFALKILAGAGTAAIALPGSSGLAQTFPSKAVRVVTPFPPGAGPDAALRLISDQLSRKWNQPVIVDNKPGGNGFIAVSAFKQGSADGYELIELDSSHITTHPTTFRNLPYNVATDFAPLGMILRATFFVAVAADSSYKTLDDIVAAAKAAPGKINYGSWFIGSPGHIGGLRLEAMTGTQMTHVPYRDFGQLYTAVSNKELDWALGSIASAGSMERAGKIRFIAVAAPQRDQLYPDVPCTAEMTALKGYEVNGWAGLFAPRSAPAGTRPTSVRSRRGPEITGNARALCRHGTRRRISARDAFGNLIVRETDTWAGVIWTASLHLD